MSQHQPPSPAPNPVNPVAPQPSGYQPQGQPAPGFQPAAQFPNDGVPTPGAKRRNTVGLIALIVAIVGFIFACIPGALIVGWVLLPIAFILAIVSFFQRDKGKGMGIAALIISVVGTIVGVIVFFVVVAASFNQAFSDESSVVEPAAQEAESAVEEAPAAADEPAPAADAAEGTRDSPLALGTTVSTDDWTVTVNSYSTDANEAVAAANQFNEAPAAGSHYESVNYTVTYTGEDSSFAMMVGVDLVTSSGTVIDGTEAIVTLEDSLGMEELFNGASATGSDAFLVPDGETVLIRVNPGMFADDMFFQP